MINCLFGYNQSQDEEFVDPHLYIVELYCAWDTQIQSLLVMSISMDPRPRLLLKKIQYSSRWSTFGWMTTTGGHVRSIWTAYRSSPPKWTASRYTFFMWNRNQVRSIKFYLYYWSTDGREVFASFTRWSRCWPHPDLTRTLSLRSLPLQCPAMDSLRYYYATFY